MDFSEDRLKMVAVCPKGLFFKDTLKDTEGGENYAHQVFSTIFEPINRNYGEKSAEDLQNHISSDPNEDSFQTDMSSSKLDNTTNIRSIEVYLAFKLVNNI